jgi:hypothetical protein
MFSTLSVISGVGAGMPGSSFRAPDPPAGWISDLAPLPQEAPAFFVTTRNTANAVINTAFHIIVVC